MSLLASNIKEDVVGILNSLLTFLRTHEEEKTYNIPSLMLDPRFKGFHLVSSYVGHEQGAFIMEEYDAKPIFLKCYHYLHFEGENEFSDVANHEDDECKVDIFQMAASNNKPAKSL